MAEALIALTLVCSAGSFALLAVQLWERRRGRYGIDAQRIGDALAAKLLDDYAEEVGRLSDDGVRKWGRERYMAMVTHLGLPAAAADSVADAALRRIRETKGVPGDKTFRGFYE